MLLAPYDRDNLFAIAQEDGVADDIKKIAMQGDVSNVHENLIPGMLQYAQEDGSISSNRSDCLIVRAISETEILINKST